MSSTSSAHQQSDPSHQPSPPSRSDPSATGSHRPGLNRTSILLIVAFLLCFTGFIYLSSKIPRITLTVQATSSRRRQNGKRRKPKLWEVSLDDDPPNVLKHLVAMHNWRPVAAWPDKPPTLPRRRQNPPRPEMVMSHQVAIAQTWVHGSVPVHSGSPHQVQFPAPPPPPPPPRPVPNPSVLNVAVLIAMPSQRQRKDTQSDHGSVPRPPIRSGLSYDDGQLLFGVARLPCKEQAVCTAPTQSGRTT